MSAKNDLLRCYQEWRQWTEAEGQAIQGALWTVVEQCQDAKFALQHQIVVARQALQGDDGNDPAGRTESDRQFRQIVGELIALEHRNNEWLARQRELASAQSQEFDRSSRNLRQVHRAYAPNRNHNWHSYS